MFNSSNFIKLLNRFLNPNHSWFNYDAYGSGNSIGSSIFGNMIPNMTNLIDSLIAKLAGNSLTGAEREANEFSAGEAQKSRDFTEYMARNKYQMETQSMEQAGINPAMVYGGGNLVPTAANGAAATSAQPGESKLFDLLPVLARLPAEVESLKASAERSRKEGSAALISAGAQARQAGAGERQAAVAEMRVEIDRAVADSQISLNDEQKDYLAEQSLYIRELKDYVSKNYDVAVKNANSEQKKAAAALKSAEAAYQNALTNEYLSNYQSSLWFAQEMMTWANTEGQDIVNKYLDPKQQQELENLRKQGVHLDKENNLLDKEGKKVTAETYRTWVGIACDISNAASRWAGIGAIANLKSGASSSSGAPFADFYGGTSYEPMFP